MRYLASTLTILIFLLSIGCRAHDISFVQRNAVSKSNSTSASPTSNPDGAASSAETSDGLKLSEATQAEDKPSTVVQAQDLPEMPKDPQIALVAILICRNSAGLTKEQQQSYDNRFNAAVEASYDKALAEITSDEWKRILSPIPRQVVEAAIKNAPTKWAEWRKKNDKKIQAWVGGLKALVKSREFIKSDPHGRCNYLSKFYTKNSDKMQVYFLLTQDELNYESNVIRTCGIISFPEECPACERTFMVNIVGKVDRNLYEANLFNERCLIEADKNTDEIASSGHVKMALALVGTRSVPMKNGFEGRFRVFREVNPDIADIIAARVNMLDQELRRRHTYWPDVAQ